MKLFFLYKWIYIYIWHLNSVSTSYGISTKYLIIIAIYCPHLGTNNAIPKEFDVVVVLGNSKRFDWSMHPGSSGTSG